MLLKARLLDEHWSLVFDDPRKATRRAFESGNFASCGTADTVTRLTEIAQVTITAKEQNALKSLGQDRNALQHYGLTHNARAVESRAGQALDFLVRFLQEELLAPKRGDAELSAIPWGVVHGIHKALRDISAYRTERRKRLRGTLKAAAHHTLTCHECGELALVIGDRCHFCGFPIGGFSPEHAADMHLIYRAIAEGDIDPQELISHCPRCRRRAWAPDIRTAASNTPTPFCFSCAAPVPGGTSTPSIPPEG